MSEPQQDGLAAYYSARAAEYDRVYEKPERQHDIRRLRDLFRALLTGRRVLEVACGTGYWTQDIVAVSESICAVDMNENVLSIAADRLRGHSSVTLLVDDAYSLARVAGNFDAGFAAFWWSHVPKRRVASFLDCFHSKLQPGALVVFADNRYVEGSSSLITRTDSDGNTYQQRRLADGREFEVLKNFPNRADKERVLDGRARDVAIRELQYYWCASYRPV